MAVRLQEWREHFPDLQKEYDHIAKVSDNTYFRDFAVHSFLEGERHLARLLPSDIAQGIYYSREFFKEASARDIVEAVDDIQQDYDENTGKYQFYSAERPIDSFRSKISQSHGRTQSCMRSII